MPDSKVSQLPAASSLEESDLIYIVQNAIDKSIQASLLPVVKPGFVIDFAGPEANVPTNWLPCDGREVDRVTYAGLFAAIGTTHGIGDGSTTFNLPDYRGRVSAGLDNMGGSAASRLTFATSEGATSGTEDHTLTESEIPIHSHTASAASAGSHTHTATTSTTGNHYHTANTSGSGHHSHTYSRRDNPPSGNPAAKAYDGSGGMVPMVAVNATVTYSGTHTHSLTTSTTGNHNHSLTTTSAGDHAHTITVDDAGSGNAHNIVQPTIAINKIIYTGSI